MFSNNEKRIIEISYFEIIRSNEDFYEICSKNTNHCWMIWKNKIIENNIRITIYHKHNYNNQFYHKHGKAFTVNHAIQQIRAHDNYVLHLLNEVELSFQ